MNLKQKVKNLNEVPGVYLMRDSQGNVIYIGKSKNLKKRLSYYFQDLKCHSPKTEKLIKNIKNFDYVITDTEFEAFILECKLIRELKPIYNKQMKNPKSYVYIVVKLNEKYPSIEISTDEIIDDNNIYFGPYRNKNTVAKALEGIKKCYKIPCNNIAVKKSACLNYSLGLCVGMCVNDSGIKYYNNAIKKIISFLKGNSQCVLEDMSFKMKEASETLNFETATMYRDYLKYVSSLVNQEKANNFTKDNNNIVIIEPLNNKEIKLFLIKRSSVVFSRKYKLNSIDKEKLYKSISNHIRINFGDMDDCTKSISSKEEIDEALIIYSYLKSKPNSYIIIPQEWLLKKYNVKIYKAIDSLFNSIQELFG